MSRFPVPEHTPLGEPSAAQGVWTTTDPEHVRDQIGFTYAVIFQDDQLVPGFAVTVCRECNIAPKVEVESRDSAPTLPAASPSSIDPPEERTVFDSWVQLKVPLSSNTVFRRAFRDVDGSARVGRILELADGLAADVGYRHAVGGYKQGVGISVATASIYSLVLNGREFVDSEDIFLRAYVTRVGSSSMEVCIEMEQIATATRAHAFFVMVALDHKKNRPRKVPAILDVPARIAEQAAARHERRLQRGKGTSVDAGSSLSPVPPCKYTTAAQWVYVDQCANDCGCFHRLWEAGCNGMECAHECVGLVHNQPAVHCLKDFGTCRFVAQRTPSCR